MRQRRTLEEIKEVRDSLSRNLPMIKNHDGREKIYFDISIFDEFINNPQMDLYTEIKNSTDIRRKRILKFINGEMV
jgi:hypothetical protein